MKKFLLPLFAFAVVSFSLSAASDGGLGDMKGLNLRNVKIPFYNDSRIQMVIFADTGKQQDQLMLGNNTFLDYLIENVNVDKIPDGWSEKIYPLNAALKDVLSFWQGRYLCSQAVFFTRHCSIDQKRNEAFGDDPVFMRSPMMDLNGVGFQADFKQHTIEVTSDVHVISRKSDSDPRKIITGQIAAPQKYHTVKTTSDSMRIDMGNNELMLIGNVKVIDGNNILTCDRLTIFLDNDKKAVPEKKETQSAAPELQGISRILADGDVVLTQIPDDPAMMDTLLQTAKSDHLEYNVKLGIVMLSGDENKPTVSRGINSIVSGDRIEILRNEDKFFTTGNAKVETIVRDKNGQITHKRIILSDRNNLDNRADISNFHGNVKVLDHQTELFCNNLRLNLTAEGTSQNQGVEKAFADGNVKVINYSTTVDPVSKQVTRTVSNTITSDQADYLENKIIFYNNVKVRDDGTSLDCDRMDMFMRAGKKSDDRSLGTKQSFEKIIAAGKVLMISKKDRLTTDLLTLLFRELPSGVPAAPGVLQSGNLQLIQILCDGSVNASSTEENSTLPSRILKADHTKSDLLKDYSEFHGNVVVIDGSNEIRCSDMYTFTAPAAKNQKQNSSANDIDSDPFAMDLGENSAPARLALSKDIDLTRIVCKNNVLLISHKADGKTQQAGGDKAEYTVSEKKMVLTAEPPNRPWMRGNGKKQYSDLIIRDMETEELRSIGNVKVIPDIQ